MPTLQMLNVAIGIVFIYLLLSLICTAINEIIEKFLKNRASDLRRGIEVMLQDNNNNLLEKLYNHPLIFSLYDGRYDKASSKKLPSYIPSANFALALMDIILPASSKNLSGAAGGAALYPGNQVTSATNAVTPSADEGSSATSGNAVPGTLVEGAVGGSSPVIKSENTLDTLRTALLNWPDSSARNALLTLIDSAEGDINKARKNIETWYNSSMDRVSGWYKRRVQIITIFVGLGLTLAMNADTISIFKGLLNNPTLQNSLVAASGEYVKAAKEASNDPKESPEARLQKNVEEINHLRLPIGWDWNTPDSVLSKTSLQNKKLAVPSGKDPVSWIIKFFGWLITALAISLGAPFWFDTLNKIMVIRSTVKPHEKSREESSEDRQMPPVASTKKTQK